MIKLSELKAARAAMTKGPYFAAYASVHSRPLTAEYNRIERTIPTDANDDDPAWDALPETTVCGVPTISGDTPTRQGECDAAGIVATHNAADVLIEIAEAEIALRQAVCDPLRGYSCLVGNHYGCPIAKARDSLDAALAKVTP